MPVLPLQSQPLASSVYQLVTEMLMTSTLPPGAKVSIEDLARTLGVSQTPIREALARIEADGLIIRRPSHSYTVAPLMDIGQVRELMELRLLIEPTCAARAALRATTADIADLRALARSLRTTRSEPQPTSRSDLMFDAALHRRIEEVAGNSVIVETMGRLRSHIRTYRLHYNADPDRVTREEHLAVVRAIASRDPVAAAAAMRVHLTNALQRDEADFLATEASADRR
jgi:DNA-binding GntR family transcriptional regulator